MILHESKIIRYGADEASPTNFIFVGAGRHRIDIVYDQGVTGTVTPKQTQEPTNTSAHHKITVDGTVTGTAIALTGSSSFEVVGPCYVGCIIASISGGAITLRGN